MKTGEAAKLLGVDPSTVRTWVQMDLFAPYLSDSAIGKNTTHRYFNDADILVLNTICRMRFDHVSWEEIATFLDSGKREQEFPQNAISTDPRTIPLPQAEQSAKAAATLAERDAALRRVTELQNELDKSRAENRILREQSDTIRQGLTEQIIKLSREIGRLEGKLSALQDNGDDN